jgi:REP element-mobilizing transposase RayT
MARHPRIDFPGAFHHVYARGIEKRDIVADQDDRKELRRRIVINLKRFNASCLAWAFLPNHFHLLFQSESANLADFMRCLMSGYSIYFNRKYERSGHLFQNRYKSSVIDTERYLLELIRYIHLNPVRSGIVQSLESLSRYPWTGHYEIMATGRYPWEKYPFIREFFSSLYFPSLEFYLAFLGEGIGIRYVESSFDEGTGMMKEGRTWNNNPPKWEMDGSHRVFLDIVKKVSLRHSVSQDRILDGRRDRITSRARREILRECVRDKGMVKRSVCEWLGITEAGGGYLLMASDHTDANVPIPTVD